MKTVEGEPNHVTESTKGLPKPAPLSNSQVFAGLNNIADADGKPGEKGSHGTSQDVTMMANVGGGPINAKPGEKIPNPIVAPSYSKPQKPDFDLAPKVPAKPAAPGKSMKMGGGSKSGSTTESETSVGSMGETGTKVGGFSGITSHEFADAKMTSTSPDMPNAFLDSSTKTKTTTLGNNVNSFHAESNSIGNVAFSLNHKDVHNDLPDLEIAGSRPYQTVSDLISDVERPVASECPDGRHCINKDQPDGTSSPAKVQAPQNQTDVDAKNMITDCKMRGDCKTEATSKEAPKAISGNLAEDSKRLNLSSADIFKQLDETEIKNMSPRERLHKFFGSIMVDKSVYNVQGTATEAEPPKADKKTVIDSDTRKHNIGFNVMLPTHLLKHFAAPRFKEHSKLLGPKAKKTHPAEVEGNTKSKGGKKLLGKMADASKRKLVANEPHIVINKAKIATVGEPSPEKGESGDIGATKPLQGLLIESKEAKPGQGDLGASAPGSTSIGPDSGKSVDASKQPGKAMENNLGSIVTLVGKVKVDRLNGKNSAKGKKHNNGTNEHAHKKMSVKDRMNVKHMKQNTSEINAANIAETGPSNSIIVSSVIVVIIASFVVVGMAVVAIVSVVARYCRIGKRLDSS